MYEMRRAWLTLAVTALLLVPSGAVWAQASNNSDAGEADGALADLKIEEISFTPEEPAPGDEVTILVQLENDGDADAGGFNVSLNLDGETLETVRVDGGMPADTSRAAGGFNWTATEGEHTFTVTVDSDDEVEESDEEDNTESEEIDVEAAEEEPDDADTDEAESEEDEAEADDDDERERTSARTSSWNQTNGTYTGEHVAFTLDESLPGIQGYTILADGAILFDEIALPGGNETEWKAHRDIFAMETDSAELVLRDNARYHLAIEAEDGNATLTVADGVNVTENTTYTDDDEDSAVYELTLGNRTLYLWGEGLTYDNGTFTLSEEARLGASFPPAEDREDHRDRMEERRERMEDRREEMRERMREAGSRYDRSNRTFEGRHVAFTLDEDLPGVAGYTLTANDTRVFDAITLSNSSKTEWRAHGVSFRLETEDGELRILDTPTAVLVVEGDEDAPATMTLADGVNASALDRGDDDDEDDDSGDRRVYRLALPDNRTAWLAGDGLALDNGTFTVEDRAHLRVIPADGSEPSNRGPGSLPSQAGDRDDRGPDERGRDGDDDRGPPENARAHALGREARTQVEQAIAHGNVSVEVHVDENETEPVALELGHVKVRRAFASADGPVKAGVHIEAPDGSPGTVVTLNLNASDLGNLTVVEAAEKLAVEFDNETIEPADDLQDVLDWRNDDGAAEFLLLVGGDKVQVLVSVPHFSPHTIEVTEASTQSEEAATNGAPGLGLAALVGAVSLATLVYTRKEV